MVSRLTSPPDTETTQVWTCLFVGRAGALARATFSSLREASAFAERHAALSGMAFGAWLHDAEGTWQLESVHGRYRLQLT